MKNKKLKTEKFLRQQLKILAEKSKEVDDVQALVTLTDAIIRVIQAKEPLENYTSAQWFKDSTAE